MANSNAWKSFASSAPNNPNLSDFKQFEKLVYRLIYKEPFQVARYNDGEWVFILKIEPYYSKYVARSHYPLLEIEEISNKLRNIINSKPPYYIGIDSSTLANMGSIKTHFELLTKKIAGFKIVYGEIFNAATVKYGLDDALKKPLVNRQVLTVGPEYMKKAKLDNLGHITVPPRSCWTAADSVEKQVEEALLANLDKHPVVLYSCSLLAKWLIDVMFKKFGDKITQLDIGSCIDPWCGINSRPWHPELARQFNLGPLIVNPYVAY